MLPPPDPSLTRGRAAFDRKAWGDAYTLLTEADRAVPLEPPDLHRLATAAYLLGRDTESTAALIRGFQLLADRGDPAGAARCAFWMAFSLHARSEYAPAAGWLARGLRLLEGVAGECVERGYLLVPAALQRVRERNPGEARAMFAEAATVGERFGDPDLTTLARHGQGRALIFLGETARGVAILDEIMAVVTSGEVSPIIAGTVYCSVISACYDMFDLRRAQEWTAALTRWCAEQNDLVPYRGQCLVRRSEIMRLHGAWDEAMAEAERACRWLSDPPGQPDAGAAWYQQAEMHRLAGRSAEAEQAYREAHRLGRQPWPGLALLRLAQGRAAAARTALSRVLDEARDRRTRAVTLPAWVEVLLAEGDVPAARAAADALTAIARETDAPLLHAIAWQSNGAVLLAEEQPTEALAMLRQAWHTWNELEAPYDAATTRLLIGQAYQRVGDREAAALEFDAARATFEDLGAAHDLVRLKAVTGFEAPSAPGGLTPRELEVLRLVASGKSNRAIAAELAISEKTAARHVSNIFLKLALSSRAAATAWAYEHRLV